MPRLHLRSCLLLPLLGAPLAAQPDDSLPHTAVQYEPERRALTITVGPFHLPAEMEMEHDHEMMMMSGWIEDSSALVTWPANTLLQAFQIRIEDAAGRQLSRRLLHHYAVIDLDRRELVYPVAHRLLGGGQESGDVRLPPSVAVPLSAGHRLQAWFMWRNDTGEDLDGVYLKLTLTWLPGNLQPRPAPVLPFWVDIEFHPGEGGSNRYDVPPGGSTHVAEFTLPVSGHLLVLSGHLHEYGATIRVEDVLTGEILSRVYASRDSDGTVREVGRDMLGLWGPGPHLEANRRYLVVVVYDNPTGAPLNGVMGVIGGLFQPDDLREWPAVDPTNPDYLRDLGGFSGRTRAVSSRTSARRVTDVPVPAAAARTSRSTRDRYRG